jgi:hypothetical protein
VDEREWKFANADKCDECGSDLPLRVCRSAAGSFIGKECPQCGPYSRLSDYMTETTARMMLAEYQAIARRGGDLRYAPWARRIGYVPGPMVRVDFPEVSPNEE